VSGLASYDWGGISGDVLGTIFEQLLPEAERIALGQYYTAHRLADFLLACTVDDNDKNIFDPAVGPGIFLIRAYDRLRRKLGMPHDAILGQLWANDISAFPAELAVINLCRQDLNSRTSYPRVIVRDFFKLQPGASVELPVPRWMPGGASNLQSQLPQFDAVIGNPPYVRSQQLDDLDPGYKASLARIAAQAGNINDSKFDAFAYFILHAESFLQPGGRLGFVTSAAWLTTAYGAELQRFLVTRLRVRALLFSDVEPFFPDQRINTVCVVAEKPESPDAPIGPDETIRFISLTRTLKELLPDSGKDTYWAEVDLLVDRMRRQDAGVYAGYNIATRKLAAEHAQLVNKRYSPRNWAAPFRESRIYNTIFGAA
jgi:type I restriction-modification system DNA methylase subunit